MCQLTNYKNIASFVATLKNEQTVEIMLSTFHTMQKFQEPDIHVYTHINIIYCIPHNIADFCALKILDVSHMNLDSLPSEINLLGCLRMLNCDGNNLTKVDISLPNLVVLNCFDNKLNEFPALRCPKLSCLHIGKNSIMVIPYDDIAKMELCVFLYFDNPFDSITNNIALQKLECKRQKFLCGMNDELSFTQHTEYLDIVNNNKQKKLAIRKLKMFEEIIFETNYYDEFIDNIIHNTTLKC